MDHIHWTAFIVVAVYMVGMLWIGIRFASRQTSTETYFVAQRSVPAWAMGFSLFATLISSVTFIAYRVQHTQETGHCWCRASWFW